MGESCHTIAYGLSSSVDCVSIAERRNAHLLSRQITLGEASATVAVIPQPFDGTTAPTPPSHLADETPPNVPVKDAQLRSSLIQQMLDVLKEAKVASEKVRTYLPGFFDNQREDLVNKLRDRESSRQMIETIHYLKYQMMLIHRQAITACLFAYRSVTETSISLSIQS